MKAPAVWLFAALASLLLCAQPSGWFVVAGVLLCLFCVAMAAASDDTFVRPTRTGGPGPAVTRRSAAPPFSASPAVGAPRRPGDGDPETARPVVGRLPAGRSPHRGAR